MSQVLPVETAADRSPPGPAEKKSAQVSAGREEAVGTEAARAPGLQRLPEPAERIVIEPRPGWRGLDWPELARYRELLYFLIWRDVKVRYKMAVFGFGWAVAVPLLSMLVYGIFGRAAGLAEGVRAPYFLFMLAGLIPWLFLQRAISDGGQSLVNHQPLMAKIYLPRLFLPAATCGGALFDLLISIGLLALLGGWYWWVGQFEPTWQALWVVPLLLLTVMAALGTAILLSAVIVLYRDLRFLLAPLTQFGLWLSGVPVPTHIFGRWEWVLMFNPYAGIVNAWRAAILGTPLQPMLLLGSVILVPVMFVVAIAYFRRVERRFADII